MRRLPLLIVVFAIATLLAVEPLLHQHPLDSASSSASLASNCVVCAAGVNRLPSIAPSIAAPRVIAYTLVARVVVAVVAGVPLFLPSRAPPAA